MWEHTSDVHGGLASESEGVCDYEMKGTGRFRKCYRGYTVRNSSKRGVGKLWNVYFTTKNIETVFKQW
jgi:hypothetical protein